MADVPGHEAARVEMAADGRVTCYVSFPSQGQGHATTTAQLVADQLGVALEAVTGRQPDTHTTPGGTGTFASRGAIAHSGAAAAAAGTGRRKLPAAAGGRLQARPPGPR